MKRKILVTGGTGYIGSHTSVELINEGFDVVILDNLYNSEAEIIDRIKTITGVRPSLEIIDICDKPKLENFFDKNRDISAIIHFAAYKAVSESVSKPLDYYYNNLVSLINLLDRKGIIAKRELLEEMKKVQATLPKSDRKGKR